MLRLSWDAWNSHAWYEMDEMWRNIKMVIHQYTQATSTSPHSWVSHIFTASSEMPSIMIKKILNIWNSWDPPIPTPHPTHPREIDVRWWFSWDGRNVVKSIHGSEPSVHEFSQIHGLFIDAKYGNGKVMKWRLREIYSLDWCELVIVMRWTKYDEMKSHSTGSAMRCLVSCKCDDMRWTMMMTGGFLSKT